MQQIILFFIKNKNTLLFLVLFFIAFNLTIQSHAYHKSKFISSANFFSGGLYSLKSNITSYFTLQDENQKLLQENAFLRQKLFNNSFNIYDSLPKLKFKFIPARVIKNSYASTNNKITIDKGSNDSINRDMGVITSQGIVGIVEKTSKNYAVVQSILNSQSQIFVQLKNTNHFGFLSWDMQNPNVVQIIDFPPLAPVKKGDTIVTGGNSAIFPKGILVGTVTDFSFNKNENDYFLTVKLFNDMTNLSHVYVIQNNDFNEIKTLENQVEDAE
jgi:rod shape-determining protein MreC